MRRMQAISQTARSTLTLRPYQQRAISDLRAAYQRGCRAPCLVLPTGAGKTVVAAEVIRSATSRGRRVLFLCHRQELITQSVAKLEAAGVTDLRIIQASSDLGNPTAPVAVASIPTLTRWTNRLPVADLVVFDECHHTKATTWASLAQRYSHSLLLGMTATPERGDGRPLGDIFDTLIVGATISELTALGHLVPCRVWAPLQTLEAGETAVDVAAAYAQHGNGERAVVFTSSLAHARVVAETLPSAEVVHGGLASRTRRATLERFSAGETRIVVNVHVLTEGWDDPGASVCILARKPQHAGTYLQMVGRVLRPSPGKQSARLIDLCGSVHQHGTPDIDRVYSLTGKAIAATDRTPISQCPSCGAVYRARRVCPECGSDNGRESESIPTVVGAPLTELPSQPVRVSEHVVPMAAKFSSICRKCKRWIQAGERIYFATAARQATHASCRQAEVMAEADRLLRECV